jgi:hypothetical protein
VVHDLSPTPGRWGTRQSGTESGSAGKEHKRLKNKRECPESENKRYGRIAPDDQDDDNGCI